jgi:2-methylcitrate dehydratase PrpD
LTAVVATARAAAGADGPEDSLDRENVYDAARICRHLGETWDVEQTYLKPYASCRYAHAATDAMLSLRRSDHAQAGGIERLVVEVFPEAFSITNETTPTTLEGAQFSIPFCVRWRPCGGRVRSGRCKSSPCVIPRFSPWPAMSK